MFPNTPLRAFVAPLLLISSTCFPALAQSVSTMSWRDILISVEGNGSIEQSSGYFSSTNRINDNEVIVRRRALEINGIEFDVTPEERVNIIENDSGFSVVVDGVLLHEIPLDQVLAALIEAGDTDAMNRLAIYFFDPANENQDLDRALSLMQRAADAGNTYAQANLSNHYYFGETIDRNYDLAFHYADLARVEQPTARHVWAMMLFLGLGTERDTETGMEHLAELAAEGDLWQAATFLAEEIHMGEYVRRDRELAGRWLQRARELGAPEDVIRRIVDRHSASE